MLSNSSYDIILIDQLYVHFAINEQYNFREDLWLVYMFSVKSTTKYLDSTSTLSCFVVQSKTILYVFETECQKLPML